MPAKRGSTSRSQVMKRNSRALITAAIRKRGPMSRVQLAMATDISRTHVSEVVDGLIADGTLVEMGSVSSRPGRPMVLLRINPDGPGAAGVWLSENEIQVCIAAADGEIMTRDTIDYETCNDNPAHAVAAIAESVRRCAARMNRRVDSLSGVGVTVAGVVDPLLGVISHTTHEPCFAGVPIAKMLCDELGLPVYAESDIRASALVHNWHAEVVDKALYVWFMDGVGSAFVSGHQLFGAEHGLAPTVGHIIMSPEGPLCHCGRKGCLETYTSTYAFIRRIWPDLDPYRMSSHARHTQASRGLDLVAQGDTKAASALAETTRYMGWGIANAISILDPQVVHVGGLLVDYLPDMVMDLVRREVMKHIREVFRGVEIRLLPTISEFALRGAVGLVLLRPYTVLQEINSRMLQLNAAS
jgi:predicted NBD/HSP70 family sugar kinase